MRARVGTAAALALLSAAAVASGGPQRTAVTATVTVSVSGGGRVQSDPAGAIDCGSSCSAELEVGATLVLRALPGSGQELRAWDGECAGRAERCELVVEGPAAVAAAFGPTQPLPPVTSLDVTRSEGGTVVSDPPGLIDCGTVCAAAWTGGGEVTIRARPSSGFRFAGWFEDCSGAGTDDACRLSLSESRNATAVFRREPPPSGSAELTVRNRNPAPGEGTASIRVEIDREERETCGGDECTYGMGAGDGVVLRPEGEGTLRSWEGACVGSGRVCRFVAGGGGAGVTASFRRSGPTPSFGVNVARSGRGRVTSDPRGIDCGPSPSCAAPFGTTTRVRLTAEAVAGSSFTGWRGDCGGTGPCTVVADTTRSVIAVFRLARRAVRVELRGRGSGAVRSTPPGITCPPECAFAFPEGAAVALAAEPQAGSLFGGWSGACTGASCALTVSGEPVARALFERCATLDFRGFVARSLRRPRRVTARFVLTGRASARVALVRNRRVVRRGPLRRLAAGTHTLRVPARPGTYLVRLTVSDPCGNARSRTRTVRVR